MFQPLIPSSVTYTLNHYGLIRASDMNGVVVMAWHPDKGDLLGKEYDAGTIATQLSLARVSDVADALATQLKNVIQAPERGIFSVTAHDALTSPWTAHGGKKTAEWADQPTEHGLPLNTPNLQMLHEVCDALKRSSAKHLGNTQRILLATLFFGEFVR